jgi:hypothetical protein
LSLSAIRSQKTWNKLAQLGAISAARCLGGYSFSCNLYGTTNNGGLGGSGYGTAFHPDATSHYTVLHQFTAGSDGANPVANLVSDTAGNLYDTTAAGGNGGRGAARTHAARGYPNHHEYLW